MKFPGQPAAHLSANPAVPLVSSDFRPTPWLRGGHAQSILPATVMPRPAVAYRRERWPTDSGGRPDGDFLDVDFAQPEPAATAAPVLVLWFFSPLIAWWLGIGLWQALVMDMALVVFFLVYTFVFNWVFDAVFGLPASARA